MEGFNAFLKAVAPERVRRVIVTGPFPQTKYGGTGQKITARDKRMGIMRFKGGEGRGGIPMKHGQRGVVYYDPDFPHEEYQFTDIPNTVLDRHGRHHIVREFKKL